MAQEAEAERGGSSIARASNRKQGYDTGQVDAFLERAHALYDSDESALTQQDIQNVSFDLAKGGYDIAQVDAALSRLERAVVDRQTASQIAEQGRVAWRAQTEELYRQIAEHASRAPRERFRDGQKKRPSYDRKQVDSLIDDVVDKAAASLGVDGMDAKDAERFANVTAASVSNAIFTQRKGKRGYDERQVDYFLNACVRLLSRIESFARVSDLMHGEGEETAGETAANPAGQYGGVAPLFPAGATQQATAAASPAVSDADKESFDALHKAEQAIFTAPAAAPAATPVVPPQPSAAVEPAPTVPAPAPVAPSFAPASAPQDDATPSVTATADTATSVAAQPQDDKPSVLPGAGAHAAITIDPDSSLAQLAHMAEASQEMDAPSAFRPHMPSLSTPSVPSVEQIIASVSEPEPATDGATTETFSPESMADAMPQSFAPAVKPVRSTPRGRVSQSVVAQEPAVAETPAPAAAPAAISVSAPAAATVAPAAPQSSEDGADHDDAASQPKEKQGTTVFPSLFPPVDTDIPDLSFPSLYGGDDKKHE
ncbi:DivIVA domain-containing protein [Bifidobacterium aerophilum]|uniref:DivIVA domain-containing protein n=1 Tax=Bifidobacterium aerophilum TaxID=1798155 RepID=A0A6N9Z4V8_9BIFI|nr:DivIVA domain-containing protein [Bifidobacterium aerophilum]NEG89739.1 DivIVA domain-containing protein [Bifidobacterium aerophilum]